MLKLGTWATGVIAGGIALGVALASTARPEPKEAPAPAWRLTGAAPSLEPSLQFADAWPADLNVPDSYRPDFDYSAEVWSIQMPEYELADIAYEPLPMPPEELPRVSYSSEETSVPAPATDDAATDPQRTIETANADARKSELTLAGLY